MVVRGEIGESVPLRASQAWVNNCLHAFPGNLVGRMVRLPHRDPLPVFSFHMPSWQIPYREFTDEDVSDVQLAGYKPLYFSELLWALLSHSRETLGDKVIVGGDFNVSEFIGRSKKQHEANREVIRRMHRLGFSEVLRTVHGKPVPTYKKIIRGRESRHQLDHLYVSEALFSEVETATTGDASIFYQHSDHLPIIVDFESHMTD